MAIKQLQAIRMPSKNLKETKEWYKDKLQLQVKAEDDSEIVFAFSEGTELVFYKCDTNHMFPFSPLNMNVVDPQTLHRDLFLKGCKLTDIDDFYDMLSYEVTDPNQLQIGIVGWEEGSSKTSSIRLGGYFLPVQQLERAYQWYKDKLGATELYSFTFTTPMYGDLRAITLDHLRITLVEVPENLFTTLSHPFTLSSNNIKEDAEMLQSAEVEVDIYEQSEQINFVDGEGHTIHIKQT